MPAGFSLATTNTTAAVLWDTPVFYDTPKELECKLQTAPPAFQLHAAGIWTWNPPGLEVNGEWFTNQRQQLILVLSKLNLPPDQYTALYQQSLDILAAHRSNYDEFGPTPSKLQVIWWNFPREHWHQLLNGFSMNFLKTPSPYVPETKVLDDSQVSTINQFMAELISLGTLIPRPRLSVHTIAPMFCLPKHGQPGEWRIIADFRVGGQNECMAKDPVYLQRLQHILPLLYVNGYSAIIDASKFFYQFSSCPEEYTYMGAMHPVTRDTYVYTGLPMGLANSPALAGRMGNAFIWSLKQANAHLFQGEITINTWSTPSKCRDSSGYGIVWKREEHLLALIFVWVDDFFVHGRQHQQL